MDLIDDYDNTSNMFNGNISVISDFTREKRINDKLNDIKDQIRRLRVSYDDDEILYIKTKHMLLDLLDSKVNYINSILNDTTLEKLNGIADLLSHIDRLQHSMDINKNKIANIESVIDELQKENIFAKRLNMITTIRNDNLRRYESILNINDGPLYTYQENEDISHTDTCLSFVVRVICIPNEQFEDKLILVVDTLSTKKLSLKITKQRNVNGLFNMTVELNAKSIVVQLDSFSYAEIVIGRHTKVLNNTSITFYTFYRVLKHTIISNKSDIPYLIDSQSLYEKKSVDLTLSSTQCNGLHVSFESIGSFEYYVLLPNFIPELYVSSTIENDQFLEYISVLYKYNLLEELLTILYNAVLKQAVSNTDNRAIEQLTFENTQSIQRLLSIIQYVPLYKEFSMDISSVRPISCEYKVPLIMIKNSYTSKAIINEKTLYVTDCAIGCHSKDNSNYGYVPSITYNQKFDSNTSTKFYQENLVYDNEEVAIYVSCIINRDSNNTICGSGYTYNVDNSFEYRTEFIRCSNFRLTTNTLNLSSPMQMRVQLIPGNRIGLMYNHTITKVLIDSILICLKNSFAVPTNVVLKGIVKCTFLKENLTINLSDCKPSQITLADGTIYFGLICTINKESNYTFDGSEFINFTVKPDKEIAVDETLTLLSRPNTTQVYKQYTHTQDEFNYTINTGIECALTNLGPGSYFQIFRTIIRAVFEGKLSMFQNVVFRGIKNYYSFANMNEFLTTFKFTILELQLTCLKPTSAGVSDIVIAYNSTQANVNALMFDIVFDMSELASRVSTLEEKVKDIEKWIQSQIESNKHTFLGSVLDTLVDILVSTAVSVISAGLGNLVIKFGSLIISYTVKAIKSVSKGLFIIGHKATTLFKFNISQPFVNGVHSLKLLIRKYNTTKGNLTKYERQYRTAIEMAEANNYIAISKAFKNMNPEFKFSEAINHNTNYNKHYVNLLSDLENSVISTVELNYHGLTAVGKLPQLRSPTKTLLNSDFGTKLMSSNKAPAHAYMVITDVTSNIDHDLVTKYVLGVSEGFTAINKNVTVGSFKLEYKFIKDPLTNKTSVRFNDYMSVGYTADEVSLLFKRYFSKHTTITSTERQWNMLSSKFIALQTSTLKSQKFILPQNQRTKALFETFRNSRSFDYNLLTNNCQNFCQDSLRWLEHGIIGGSLNQHSDQLAYKYVLALRDDLESFV